MCIKREKKAKNNFEKDFFKLMNNYVFGKTVDNVRNHRDINFITRDKIRNNLVTKYFLVKGHPCSMYARKGGEGV